MTQGQSSDLRPRGNYGQFHLAVIGGLKLCRLSRFVAHRGTSDKCFRIRVNFDRIGPGPWDSVGELAIDVTHIARVIVSTCENSFWAPFDLGSSCCLGDGVPFGIQLILRDEHVGAAGEEEDAADCDYFTAGNEVHRAFMSRLC